MGIALDFYSTLDDKLFNMIGYKVRPFEVKYMCNGTLCNLTLDDTDGNNVFLVRDDKCQWEPREYNLIIERNYTISNHKFLFGKNGVACSDAEIGLAVMWMSKASNQRGVEFVDSIFMDDEQPKTSSLNLTFAKGQINGLIKLKSIFYLKKSGNPSINEVHLSNIEGSILGYLDEYTFIIDGNGSVFPIVQVNNESGPLWWIDCDWQDSMQDEFSQENVRICINSAHKNFKSLNLDKGIGESQLLIEIIATAVQIIIEKVKQFENIDEIIEGKGFEEGSIADAVNYFINTFDLDITSSEKLATSLRIYLDNRI